MELTHGFPSNNGQSLGPGISKCILRGLHKFLKGLAEVQ